MIFRAAGGDQLKALIIGAQRCCLQCRRQVGLQRRTIAGEGVREIVQVLLLAHKIGTSQSIISAALGFWAAEAPTLSGAIFYFMRHSDYRPLVEVQRRSRAA